MIDWIPIDKTIPKESGAYLVTDDVGRVVISIFYLPLNDGETIRFCENGKEINVVAWMPLPKKYIKVNNDFSTFQRENCMLCGTQRCLGTEEAAMYCDKYLRWKNCN